MKRALSCMLVAFTVGACSAPSPVAPTSEPPATTAAGTPTPSPTPEAATPEQVASIIARDEPDWREVIDNAFDCRYLWVVGGEDAIDDAEAMTCYLRELTMVSTTGTAAKELQELDLPSEMEHLVSETLWSLSEISTVDLEGTCGDDSVPNDSAECNDSLGTLSGAYVGFEKVLNKWQPYL